MNDGHVIQAAPAVMNVMIRQHSLPLEQNEAKIRTNEGDTQELPATLYVLCAWLTSEDAENCDDKNRGLPTITHIH